jgi:lysozyme
MKTPSRNTITALALSSAGLIAIASSEGFVEKAYRDIVGVWTIGFGTTANVKPGDTITVERALERKLDDVRKFHDGIAKCVTVPLTQGELDAYISLAYNIGVSAFCSSTLVKLLNAKDYDGACKQILRWNRAGGKVVRGLVLRREREYQLCTGGKNVPSEIKG